MAAPTRSANYRSHPVRQVPSLFALAQGTCIMLLPRHLCNNLCSTNRNEDFMKATREVRILGLLVWFCSMLYILVPRFRVFYTMSSNLEKSKQAALWGMLIGDSIAMPVHWYYNPNDIKSGYGNWLTGYRAPARRHPSSILTLSAVDGSGRTGWHSKKKNVIGDIILHDKLEYWTSSNSSIHYHQGMKAGDNTLNALTAMETIKTMQAVDRSANMDPANLREAVMENYVNFMTTPNTHNDTYAESFHRSLFQDWSSLEKPPKDGKSIVEFCIKRYDDVSTRRNEDHQLAVIGAVVISIPWTLHYSHLPADDCAGHTVEAIKMTHPAPSLMPFIDLYSRTLHAVLNGAPLKQEVLKAVSSQVLGGSRKKNKILAISKRANRYNAGSESQLEAYQDGVSSLGMACYIEGALSSLLLLAYDFHDDFVNGTLTNANCGGENAHRGAALSALLAAETVNQGKDLPPNLKDGLNSAKPSILEALKGRI